jgi:hypothetical protein
LVNTYLGERKLHLRYDSAKEIKIEISPEKYSKKLEFVPLNNLADWAISPPLHLTSREPRFILSEDGRRGKNLARPALPEGVFLSIIP